MLQLHDGWSSYCGKRFPDADASTAVPVEGWKESALEPLTSLLYPGWVHKAGLGPPAPLPESHQPQEGRFHLKLPGSSTGRGPLLMAGWEAPLAPDLLLHPGRGTTGSIAVLAAVIRCL